MPKLSLQSHHIIDLFVALDDALVELPKPKGGRPKELRDSELATLLVWSCLTTVRCHTLKDLHSWALMYHRRDFPKLPTYGAFLSHCHRMLPAMVELLQSLLASDTPVRIMDATKLPVCRLQRAEWYRVAKGVADFGKNHQGWWLGFKLHASINGIGQLCGLALTPASTYDAQMIYKLVNEDTKVVVGDGTYNASVMRRKIWERFGTIIVAPPHYKQTRQVMAKWQHLLLLVRPKIEAVFDYLKEHMHLVSSFPRSVNGYFLHYIRVLLGYQILVGGF